MQAHTKIYLNFFGYGEQSFIPSEINETRAGAIHHIQRRGRGGDASLDRIENIMALTPQEHEDYGDKKCFKAMLYRIHKLRLQAMKKEFDEAWIDAQIARWEPFEEELKG